MSKITLTSVEQLPQVNILLTELLQQQDYFNTEKMDRIQILAIGQADYFEEKIWQALLKNQKDIHRYFTDFLTFYVQNYQLLSDLYAEEINNESKKMESFFEKHIQNFNVQKSANQDESFKEIILEDSFQQMQSLEKLMSLNYWLRAFTPFAEQNIALVWTAFKQLPYEIFPCVLNISAPHLRLQDIELFYDLFAQQKLDFAEEGQRPTDYIQHFYDQFPELLLQISHVFEQTHSIQLKSKLLMCLYYRQTVLAEPLQQFILEQFIRSDAQGEKDIFTAALYALAKCQTIEISDHIIQKVQSFLYEDEIWYMPMVAMRTLSALGVRDLWFKQHLLTVLDQSYGCDGETPQGTSIEILVSWGEEGLYATDKIIQLLKQAIQENDQHSIMSLIAYTDAAPSLAVHFQPLLWHWIEDLSQQTQDECWIKERILKTFLQLSAWNNWQPNTVQWHSLVHVLKVFLEYLLADEREQYFELITQQLKLENTQIKELKQCVKRRI